MYEFAYRTVNYYRNLGRVYPVQDETLIYEQPGVDRFDWRHPCGYVYSAVLLRSNDLRFPLVKIHEDVTFVEMALYWAKVHTRINRIIFNYWECLTSYLHSTSTVGKILHINKAYEEEWKYFSDCGHPDYPSAARMTALTTVENMPYVCSELDHHKTREFVDEHCNRYLLDHPQEKLWSHCQKTLDAYNAHPTLFWLESRITTGIPLTIKRVCYRIPGLRWVTNMFYSKYVLKMTPIKR